MEFQREVTTTLPGHPAKKTRVTIVRDDERAWDALAMRAAIVAVQARWRAAGEIPAEDTIPASELVGRRGRPANPIKRAKEDPVYRRRIIAELMELDRGDEGGGE
jgi:hypothetical protein